MEAKDTVIELKQLTVVRTAYPANEVSKAQMVADQKKVKEQHEISFKAGIKKVVDWIEENYGLDDYDCYGIPQKVLQAKLKEWDIKED